MPPLPHRHPRPWNRWRIAGWSIAAVLMLLPLVAMQFAQDVRWGVVDFAIVGGLVLAIGGAVEGFARHATVPSYRIGGAVALVTALLLIWINLAVGMIGSEDNAANAMYAGVLAIATGGAIAARLRATGMARAMAAAAVAQCAVGAIAIAADLGTDGANWPRDVIGGSALFATLWLTAAGLFARSARKGA